MSMLPPSREVTTWSLGARSARFPCASTLRRLAGVGRAALALALVVAACDRAAHEPEQQKTVPALVAPTRTESPTADPAQQPACTLEPWAPAGPEDEALLVLVGDETSVATYWVQRQGRATRWLGWSDSAIFTWNGGVWRAGSEHHEQKTEGCQTNPDAPAEPGTATTEHLVLLRLDAPGRIEPLGSPQVPRARRDASSESRVIGLVGPYLCIRSDDSADD